ncbi:MAG TPA: DUF1365 domain-containing protein [Woeseiaceae bacterium]|nr:DUF1365 domain-containing protein [Woeseiaceae bacterium]
MESCIYEGQVRHTRAIPAQHKFSYRVFLMYLDLDELPQLFERRWLWSTRHPALARFKRANHLGPENQALSESVRDRIEAESGYRPMGPIRLLTNLSYFGYCFNPVSFYYCFAEDKETVEFIVSEVSNTPWGECDCYVLDCRSLDPAQAHWRFRPKKKMHVSPFMPMQVDYDWAMSPPLDRLSVFMANSKDGVRIFSAAMMLRRKPITGRSLAGVLIRYPLHTFKIISSIYWQALRLWVKRVPFYTHPDKKDEVTVR